MILHHLVGLSFDYYAARFHSAVHLTVHCKVGLYIESFAARYESTVNPWLNQTPSKSDLALNITLQGFNLPNEANTI